MSESAVANKVETDFLVLTEEQVDALADAWEAFLAAPQGKRTWSMLSAFDPFAAAVRQVAALPAEGLAFVVMTPPADGVEKAMLDSKGPIGFLSQRIRAVNPNAHLLLLPAGWSFRTMDRKQAREFAANMLAFVPDDDLEALGLRRVDALDRVEAPPAPPPARSRALLPGDIFERLQALDPPVGMIRIKTVHSPDDGVGIVPSVTVRTEGRVPDAVQDELAARMEAPARLVFKDDAGVARVARPPLRTETQETARG